MTKYPYEAPKDEQDLWDKHENLIRTIAWKFHRRYPDVLELDEKVSLVFLSLAKCLNYWKPNSGASFVSYSYMSAWRALSRAMVEEIIASGKPGPVREPGKYGQLVQSEYNFQESRNDEECDRILYAMYRAEQYTTQDPEAGIGLKQLIAEFRAALPEHHRASVDLLLQGYTQVEVAEATGKSRQAINQAYCNARKKMKR